MHKISATVLVFVGNLRTHIIRTHSTSVAHEKTFRCEECSCSFKKLGSLNAHHGKFHAKLSSDLEKSVSKTLPEPSENAIKQVLDTKANEGSVTDENATKDSISTPSKKNFKFVAVMAERDNKGNLRYCILVS